MGGTGDLLLHARHRADALRARYRADRVWSGLPLDVVRSAAADHPTRTALIARDAEVSYADLDTRVDAAAQALRAAGVSADSPLVIVVGNDIESVVIVHAAIRIDAVVLLVPRSAGAAQIIDIVGRTGAVFGVAPGYGQELPEGSCTWVNVDYTAEPAVRASTVRAADEPSFVLYTSGTTSRPKGVIHSLSTLLKASTNYIAAAGLAAEDRIFLISPLASVTGVVQALFIAPLLGAPIVLEDRWNPPATCDLLLSSKATWYGGPDRLLDRLLDEAGGRPVPLRAVYLGGTALDRRIVERVEDDFGIVVMRAYGSSEVPVSTSGLRTESRSTRHADDGVPLQDVEVREGSSGDPGECCIKGPHTFLGYADADDDGAAFDGDWFRTGDVADLSGGRVRIVGRIKDIVIRNGLKIPSAEVEEAVSRIAGVRECAAYSVPDSRTGERLAVALVLEAGADVSLSDVAGALIADGLPKYKLPEELVFWNQPLPINANGKIERNTLHARSNGRPRMLADRLSVAP
ncbi:class I adenylate-forming enzyme family protein [Mycobacterium sp. EPa45]|uniref:class I adenylate-forming enzyme family protein n=1 Tax=Mycobacterium sp. EPa45 TaxID=1545728 RepID=UPI000641B85B|nr:AMP-binding protein [Mycobacterium sp. EPa45]AKK27685.1 AMP-dependent synthetase [Mycobacterium sp. EPa45]